MQHTLKNIITVSGIGIHTGVNTSLTLKPSLANTGIQFIRTDLKENVVIKADIDNIFSTSRSTVLKKGNTEIHTVEHILAAIIGSEIDNIIIEVNNIEIPILDGSAKLFTELILESGKLNQKVERKFFEIKRKISFKDEETGTILTAEPAEEYQLDVTIDYKSKALKTQKAVMNSITEFNTEFASSRTFCFLHELEILLDKNLIKGGDLNNAIGIAEERIPQERLNKLKNIFNKQDIEVTPGGTLNNLTLRHDNEPARHKLLDIIGDLALIGRPIKGKITAYKPGHRNNTNFAKKLKQIMKEEISKTAPIINLDDKPMYDRKKIIHFCNVL